MHKILNKKTPSLVLGFILTITSLVLILSSPAYAAPNAQNTYTYIYMPSGNLTNVSHEVTINNVPNLGSAGFFWSDSLYFTSAPSDGSAYFGIQGINRALFSVFDYPSTEASSNCTVQQSGFDGGAYTYGGTSCIINYTIVQGHTYLLTVTDIGQDSQGTNWQATVEDLETGITTDIATVNIATSWGTLTNTQDAWTEWFGATPSSCATLPYSNVTFSDFTANNGQYTSPSSSSDALQTGTGCTGYSQIVDNNYNSFTQIMGIDPPITNTIVPYSPPSAPVTPPVKKTTPLNPVAATTPIATPTIVTAPTTTVTAKPSKPIRTTLSLKTSNKAKPLSLGLAAAYTAGIGIPIILIIFSIFFFERILPRRRLAHLPSDSDIHSSSEIVVSSLPVEPTTTTNYPQLPADPAPPTSPQPIIINPTNPPPELPKE